MSDEKKRIISLGTRPLSLQGVSNIEEREFQEIAVMGVQCLDAMVAKQSSQMGIRHQISPSGDLRCRAAVDVPKSFSLGEEPRVRKAEKCFDVCHRFVG